MDLKIAAIALSRNAYTPLPKFDRFPTSPGLIIEDWPQEE
jgi:hypothetical protein